MILACGAACQAADEITRGMPEKAVLEKLGKPSFERTDVAEFWLYIKDASCRGEASKIMVYDYTVGDDAIVAMDKDSRVKCVERRNASWFDDKL